MQKLLLLEDDASLIDGLTYSLKKNGFYIEIARTLREAEILLAKITDFVLLLFDVTLPDGNGFTLCERLRESSACRQERREQSISCSEASSSLHSPFGQRVRWSIKQKYFCRIWYRIFPIS